MLFYALRIVCQNCGAASLLGGSAQNDLTPWRDSMIECRCCGAEVSTADAPAVDLRALPREAGALERRVEHHPNA